MTQKQIAKLFPSEKNIMTPNIIRYGQVGSNYYELSSGRGINNQAIYGVTVITNSKHNSELSNLCFSLDEAESHINNLS